MLFLAPPPTPTGFNITREYHGEMETIVTLDWDTNGSEKNYTVSVSATSVSNLSYVVDSSPLNITLAHNVSYSVSITAVNCAGESAAQTIEVKISKCCSSLLNPLAM